MEFWSALTGALVGGVAAFGAAMWTMRRAAAQAESDWRRGKKAEALVEFDLIINVVVELGMAGKYSEMEAALSSPEWTRAERSAILWAPRLHREVHEVADELWAYANQERRDESGLAYSHSRFEEGMRRELNLESVSEATKRTPELNA